MKIIKTENGTVLVENCDGDQCKYTIKDISDKKIDVYAHAKLTKQEDATDERFIIEGFASTEDLDRGNDVVHSEAFNKTIKEFLKTTPIMLFMHDMHRPLGALLEAKVVPGKGLWIRGFVSETEKDIQIKISEGILNAFSFGFFITKFDEEQDSDKNKNGNRIRHIREVELLEVSVVSIPMNRQALFSVSKALSFGTDLAIPGHGITNQLHNILNKKDKDSKYMTLVLDKEDEKEIILPLIRNEDGTLSVNKKTAITHQDIGDLLLKEDKGFSTENVKEIMDDIIKSGGKLEEEAYTVTIAAEKYYSMLDEIKVGRVLSAKNRSAVATAYDALGKVLLADDESRASTPKDDEPKKSVVRKREFRTITYMGV